MLVLAGQVTLDDAALRAAGISAAFALADYAGSVQLAIDDAANQLTELAPERHHRCRNRPGQGTVE